MNLIVQDGLSKIKDFLTNIRESVKFLKHSPSIYQIFLHIVYERKLETKSKCLLLDCPTRWNFTYHMMKTTLLFKDAFKDLAARDPNYVYLPNDEEWRDAVVICKLLEIFSYTTEIMSSSRESTSSQFLICAFKIKNVILKAQNDPFFSMREMLKKFENYWGEQKFDALLLPSIAAVLDLRGKKRLLYQVLPPLYGKTNLEGEVSRVIEIMHVLYKEYESIYKSPVVQEGDTSMISLCDSIEMEEESGKFMQEFYAQLSQDPNIQHKSISKLDKYLEAAHTRSYGDFALFGWWKQNQNHYPILSILARDILAVPMSTVASESVFSTGGRVIDKKRSSLAPKTIKALICGGSWLRDELQDVSETKDDVNEEDVLQIPPPSNVPPASNTIVI